MKSERLDYVGGERPMKKYMTGAEKRFWIEYLLDAYAPLVWRLVEERYESTREAEDAFVYVFTLAISRLDRLAATNLSESWFESLTTEAMQSTPPALPHDDGETAAIERHLDGVDIEEASEDETEPVSSNNDDLERPFPGYLYQRAVQMMRASIATQEAMKHHRGTPWTKLGALSVVVIGVCGIGYGVSGRLMARFHPPTQQSSMTRQSVWSNVAGNLPVTPLSVYALTPSSTLNLAHFSVGSNALYGGALVQSADSWPEIHVSRYMFTETNKNMSSAKTQSFKIELVPPLKQPAKKSTTSSNGNWQIGNWQLDWLDSRWLIAIVDWHNGGSTGPPTKQIYGLNLANRTYSLLDTLRPQTGVANRFVVAVGDGRVVVQPALDDGTGASVLGLSIEVYTMNGSDPLHAWTKQKTQIPASFGLMESPIATKTGLVFQGIAGKTSTPSSNSSVWYEMSWGGQLSSLQGPPVDGQSHWAVMGQSGDLWWAETTPVAAKAGSGYQVSMGKLAASPSTTAVKNLSSSVAQLSVSGSHLMWIEQSTGNGKRLVVGQVQ